MSASEGGCSEISVVIIKQFFFFFFSAQMITKLQGSETQFSDVQKCTPVSFLPQNLLKLAALQVISPQQKLETDSQEGQIA